jgi:aromatic-L-amino-acid decarboxylase
MEPATYAERLVRAEAGLEVLSPATLGVLCFRAHPAGVDDPAALDALNERVNAAVNAKGRYFMSSTRLHGTLSLRICPIGFRTTMNDVRELLSDVVEAAGTAA